MKPGGRGLTAGRDRVRLRRALVVAQLALSLVLVVGALLFARTLRNLATLDPGFRADGVLVATVDFSRLQVPVERRNAFRQELVGRVRALPGVDAASDTSIVPLSGNASGNDGIYRLTDLNNDGDAMDAGEITPYVTDGPSGF